MSSLVRSLVHKRRAVSAFEGTCIQSLLRKGRAEGPVHGPSHGAATVFSERNDMPTEAAQVNADTVSFLYAGIAQLVEQLICNQ